MKHKIYCFNNGGPRDWLEAVAIGDDGHVVGQHICSHEAYMHNDLGLTSDWKHDSYNKQYGEGNWELEWVPTGTANDHEGLQNAFKLNKELGLQIPDEVKAGVTITFSNE